MRPLVTTREIRKILLLLNSGTSGEITESYDPRIMQFCHEIRLLKRSRKLLWPDKDREGWFSLGESPERRGFDLHQLQNHHGACGNYLPAVSNDLRVVNR